MDLEKQIVDQRLSKIVETNSEWFPENASPEQKRDRAFVILGTAAFLSIDIEEASTAICDGANDAKVDAIYCGDVENDQFTVCLVQSKYTRDLEKDKNFPQNAIEGLALTISCLFDPKIQVNFNSQVMEKLDEIRALILEGNIPNVRIACLNNGPKWNAQADEFIRNTAPLNSPQVELVHVNHKDIIQYLQEPKSIDTKLQLVGEAVLENFPYKRVIVGKTSVSEIARLIGEHGDNLLERNIRRFLGFYKNRVNSRIRETLLSDEDRKNFYFYNNGITMLCEQFRHNQLAGTNWQLQLSGLQIINGGQTSKTIEAVHKEYPNKDFSEAQVLVRIYELAEEDDAAHALTTTITMATNSQSPVDLRDLRANDTIQKKLAHQAEEMGYEYITKRSTLTSSGSSKRIPSSVAAEAVFSIWKQRPNSAKFRRKELFGKNYTDIFEDTNMSQIILAVLMLRYADNARKKLSSNKHSHLAYSVHFVAMSMGAQLVKEDGLNSYKEINHQNFDSLKELWDKRHSEFYETAVDLISDLLPQHLPQRKKDDRQKISALFRRRGLVIDLIKASQ